MVLAPSTFLLVIPFQPATTNFIIVKSKQKNYRQEFDQQHGLKSCHLFVFFSVRAMYFALELKVLKDDNERFEIFPPGHIYSNKSDQK